MEILLQLLLLAVGFVMLVKGADAFVEGAAGIAEKFGIPQLVIGLTIVAMGTSAPEAAVSITAALKGNAAITIGNVVGSNILNVLVILGITSVIVSVAVARSTVRIEIPYMLVITLLLLVLGLSGNKIVYHNYARCNDRTDGYHKPVRNLFLQESTVGISSVNTNIHYDLIDQQTKCG